MSVSLDKTNDAVTLVKFKHLLDSVFSREDQDISEYWFITLCD